MTEDKKKSAEILTAEREALKKFLESSEYRLAQKVVDLDIQTGIDFILDLEVVDIASAVMLLEARGEIRANKKFGGRFKDRLQELEDLLGKHKQPLDD